MDHVKVPPVAALAIRQAERMELDPQPIRELAARLGHGRDPLFPLCLGREHLRGLLEGRPDDLRLVVALGLISAASGQRSEVPPDPLSASLDLEDA